MKENHKEYMLLWRNSDMPHIYKFYKLCAAELRPMDRWKPLLPMIHILGSVERLAHPHKIYIYWHIVTFPYPLYKTIF